MPVNKPLDLTPKGFCWVLYVIIWSYEGKNKITEKIHRTNVSADRVELLERYMIIDRLRNSQSLRSAKRLWRMANWLWLDIPDVKPPKEWKEYFNEHTKRKGEWY